MRKSPERARAFRENKTTYQGRACARCGSSLRYTANCGCVACTNHRAQGFKEFPNITVETPAP